jgi:hypothetical protein
MRRSLLLFLWLLPGCAAWATPVRWTLSGVTFSGIGGTASGTFVYDADTNTYSQVDITTSAFSILVNSTPLPVPAPHYTGVNTGSTSTSASFTGGGANLTLNFAQPLTNAGGSIALVTTVSGGSVEFVPSSGPLVQRLVNGGAVTTVVPVPTLSETSVVCAALLLAAGAAVLLRRRAAAA